MKYEKEIRKIISKIIANTKLSRKIKNNTNLQDIGIDSLSFVEIIIEIEKQFDIEFPDNKLVISENGTIKKLCKIVEDILK